MKGIASKELKNLLIEYVQAYRGEERGNPFQKPTRVINHMEAWAVESQESRLLQGKQRHIVDESSGWIWGVL